jgi:hypothetical protein
MIIAPPIIGHIPMLSSKSKNTHKGFNIGSNTGINTASKAETYFTAFEYSIYGIPN